MDIFDASVADTVANKASGRQSYLDSERFRVFQYLLDCCENELEENAQWLVHDDESVREVYRARAKALKNQAATGDEDAADNLCREVQQEAKRRFLSHVCQLFYLPSSWDCKPATVAQQTRLLSSRGPEVMALYETELKKIWASRAAAFEQALARLIAEGHVKTKTGEDGSNYIARRKPS